MAILRSQTGYNPFYVKYDFMAGIVVFLVAIPLCLGIALASGAPLFSGIIAGIVGGVVVGILSNSPVSVSGPAAGMVAIVLAAITELGGFNTFLLALVFAGILQIIIGSLRAGFMADYIPSNVIQGLLCAIGLLIIVKQVPFILTYTSENKALLTLLKSTSGNLTFIEFKDIFEHINLGALMISLVSFSLLIYFDKTKNSIAKQIPGPIVVVIAGTVINELYGHIAPTFVQYSTELVNIPEYNNLHSFLSNFQMPSWESWHNPNVYLYAGILAIVASLETLLNIQAIEKLGNVRRHCSRNRELIAQGVGNTISGLMGGLPITSVIVRSSVNMNSGARTKMATIFHGTLILLVALMIPHWMNAIPLAALATILIYVGYKLTHPVTYQNMYRQGFARFLPFAITVAAILVTNLLTGIIIGLLAGFFFILRENSKIQLDIINEKYPSGDIKRLVLPQHMSFLRKASLVSELDSIPNKTRLIIDARHTQYMDKDIQEVLDTFKKNQAPEKEIALNMLGFKDHYEIHDHVEFFNITSYKTQSSLKPRDVFNILKEGNKRFVLNQTIHRYLPDDIKASSYTQHPIAIILGCIDSRVPVESVFDMGFGDVFVLRIAGNVINDDVIASIEFACHVSGAKLIVALGHTYCGAIKAACDHHGGDGKLNHLLDKIKPAINAETLTKENRTSNNIDFVTNVTKLNIEKISHQVQSKSIILNRLIREGNVGLVGAIYDIKTGLVNFDEENIILTAACDLQTQPSSHVFVESTKTVVEGRTCMEFLM